MSELADIKARAAERRKGRNARLDNWTQEPEADLDRAIAIAEEVARVGTQAWQQVCKERDEARAEVDALKVKLAAAGVVIENQAEELAKARAAAKALRDRVRDLISVRSIGRAAELGEKVLADTEWLEQYR